MDSIQVLIADDEMSGREATKTISTQIGCTIVGEATNGFEAIELSQLLQPDVILMDADMPYLDGLAAIQYCTIPVIILAAEGELPEIVGQTYGFGASACLGKPFTAGALERAIAIAVAH
jgi:AmiR/NasT family two-component response regulator